MDISEPDVGSCPTSSKMMGMPRALQAWTRTRWNRGSGWIMPPAPCMRGSMRQAARRTGLPAAAARAACLQCTEYFMHMYVCMPQEPATRNAAGWAAAAYLRGRALCVCCKTV